MSLNLAIIAVACAFALVSFLVYRAGPGVVKRLLTCPEKKCPTCVEFVRTEGEFGSLRISDVRSCTLLPDGVINCAKSCMS